MFLVLVAADIFANKVNFELSFATRPSIQELQRAAETAFSAEITQRRPAGVPAHVFSIAKLKVYDDDTAKWVELLHETQLIDSAQCYAFQPPNPWHHETQQTLPPAVRPPTSAPPGHGNLSLANPAAPSSSSIGHPRGSGEASLSAGRALTMSYSAVGQQSGGSNTRSFPLDASVDEKVRMVFAEFDVKQQRIVDFEDLKRGFLSLGFKFSDKTIDDLFQKGDLNHDGRIQFSEFERFSKWYPIMLDCLYYRTRAFWEDKTLEREIKSEQDIVVQAESLVEQAEAAHRSANEQEESARSRVLQCEQEIRERQQRQRDLADQADQLQRDRERTAKEKADKETELQSARNAERAARGAQLEAQREVESKERRLGGASAEAHKADDRVKQLEAQLAEARRVAERAHGVERQAQQEAEHARQAERAAAANADTVGRDIPRKDEQLKHAESLLSAVEDRLREVDTLGRENQREQQEASRSREGAEREVLVAQDAVSRMAEEVAAKRRQAEERARVAKQREEELREQQAARSRATAEEQKLVEEEIRLRTQRETLETKETRLQDEARAFLGSIRTSINSRGASVAHRDSSYAR